MSEYVYPAGVYQRDKLLAALDKKPPVEVSSKRLFCTFTSVDGLEITLSQIMASYEIRFQKIFVLSSPELPGELVCTYNVEEGNVGRRLPATIMVHRHKETDTLYTIDALNLLVRKENNGQWVANYPINWPAYRRQLLLTSEGTLRLIPTQLFRIVPVVRDSPSESSRRTNV